MVLDGIKHIILVLSGKGGVGKSTVSAQLALTLRKLGFKVGILDLDLCGPNIPLLLGLEEKEVFRGEQGWIPVYTEESKNFSVMSIGFLLKDKNDAVIWRGPKKTAIIKQFLNDVYWENLDYLIIDTPPGTSDEHITVMECMQNAKCDGAIIVTTPQEVALEDVRKEITFCNKTGIKIIGLIENMSGYVCPHCSNCTNIFSSKGGQELAVYANIPHLGTLPIDPKINSLFGTSLSVVSELPESVTAKVFSDIGKKIISTKEFSI